MVLRYQLRAPLLQTLLSPPPEESLRSRPRLTPIVVLTVQRSPLVGQLFGGSSHLSAVTEICGEGTGPWVLEGPETVGGDGAVPRLAEGGAAGAAEEPPSGASAAAAARGFAWGHAPCASGLGDELHAATAAGLGHTSFVAFVEGALRRCMSPGGKLPSTSLWEPGHHDAAAGPPLPSPQSHFDNSIFSGEGALLSAAEEGPELMTLLEPWEISEELLDMMADDDDDQMLLLAGGGGTMLGVAAP